MKKEADQAAADQEAAKKDKPALTPGAIPGTVLAPLSGAVEGGHPVVQTVGHYRFKNRLVPEAPHFLKDDTKSGMVVDRDETSNSWVWIGTPLLGAQILDLASSYDIEQMEVDLEFCLVLISTDRLKSNGLSLFYQRHATWLNSLSLTGDADSLLVSTGAGAVRFDFANNDSGVTLLSQPVIRCVDGQAWQFANDSEVPVPKSDTVNGVTQNSVEFHATGFGLTGTMHVVGDQILLKVNQRNGSISPATAASYNVPTFNNQKMETTLALKLWRWAVLGGIQVDKEQIKKTFFSKTVESTTDYLIVFVRARDSLVAPPKAVPVADDREQSPLIRDYSVLPSKLSKAEREEIDLINKELKIRDRKK